MLADVVAILRCGRRAAVACLLSMRRTLDRDEYKHYLSRLYLDDYCVWLQTARFGSARLLRVWAALADTPGWDGRNGATASAPCWTSQASLPRTGRARPTSAGRSRFLRPRLGQRPTTTTPTRSRQAWSRQACKACKKQNTKKQVNNSCAPWRCESLGGVHRRPPLPPAARMVSPVMYDASSESRKVATPVRTRNQRNQPRNGVHPVPCPTIPRPTPDHIPSHARPYPAARPTIPRPMPNHSPSQRPTMSD